MRKLNELETAVRKAMNAPGSYERHRKVTEDQCETLNAEFCELIGTDLIAFDAKIVGSLYISMQACAAIYGEKYAIVLAAKAIGSEIKSIEEVPNGDEVANPNSPWGKYGG